MGIIYDVIISRKVKNTFIIEKNLKKTFLQLRCSIVLLHLEYKLLLCKPKIKCRTFREQKH